MLLNQKIIKLKKKKKGVFKGFIEKIQKQKKTLTKKKFNILLNRVKEKQQMFCWIKKKKTFICGAPNVKKKYHLLIQFNFLLKFFFYYCFRCCCYIFFLIEIILSLSDCFNTKKKYTYLSVCLPPHKQPTIPSLKYFNILHIRM